MSNAIPVIRLKQSTQGKDTALFSPSSANEKKLVGEKGENAILCKFCGHLITRQNERIEVKGRHSHVFANPHGLVFRIRCFYAAPGCIPMGSPTNEFTWFTGFSWRVVICGRCAEHMGWRFSTNGSDFHGLIADHLMEGPEKRI